MAGRQGGVGKKRNTVRTAAPCNRGRGSSGEQRVVTGSADAAHGRCRRCASDNPLLLLTYVLVVEVEVGLLDAADLRDAEWAAQVIPKDVPLLRRDALTLGNKVIAGVQEGVAEKFPPVSVVGVSAALGLNHHNSRSDQIVLGAVVVLQHLDLRDFVRIGHDGVLVMFDGIEVPDSIEDI